MTNRSNGVEAPGVDASKVVIPSLEDIEKWMNRDLGICISFLNALHTDADLRRQMAIFMQGRFSNSVNKPDPNQINLGL